MEKMAGLSGKWVLVKRAWRSAVSIFSTVATSYKPFGFTKNNHNSGETKNQHIIKNHSSHRFFSRSLVLAFLFGFGFQAQAGEFCSASPFFGTIDANNPAHMAALDTQITIDTNCSFLNFSDPNPPLTVTLNFQTNDPTIYLIVFDNTDYVGNMACANIDHKIWFVNGSEFKSDKQCQDLFIPVETIDKQAPAQTTVGIGEVFTYTLIMPSMQFTGLPSTKELRDVTIQDDLSAVGADLTFVSANAYEVGTLNPVTLVPETNPASLCGVWTTTNLCYEPIPSIPAGTQIAVEFTVAVADTVGNIPGTQFTNVAKWWFGRWIDLNDDGIETPDEQFTPLPGENGIAATMTIGEPDLVVNKTNPDTAINIGTKTTFTIDVQNNGGSNAYDITVDDFLPDVGSEGMCDYDPTLTPGEVTAAIYEADGTTLVRSLTIGVGNDYTATYYSATDTPSCQLTFQMTSANAVIGPTQRLRITYVSQLDTVPIPVNNGVVLTNYVGATQYYSGDGSYNRTSYSNTITDGSPGADDFQDSFDMTTALVGYIFQKTVQDLSSGANPAVTASSGDTMRYRLRLFNFTETIDDLDVTDTLDPTKFDLTTFTPNPATPLPGNATYTFNTLTGDLHIFGTPLPGDYDLTPGNEFLFEFDIQLLGTLTNGQTVSNQAFFTSTGSITSGESDDPFINGIATPVDPGDPTDFVILEPGPLLKTNGQATATIGNQFTYTVKVPDTPVTVPLYDVRLIDDLTLSNADMTFVSATVTGSGSWTVTNTGSSTSLVLEDLSTGIDIPANEFVTFQITVELANTSKNQAGTFFNNQAYYTFNRTNGNPGTQAAGPGATSGNMLVVEPNISNVVKLANNTTPTAGGVIRYSVTLLASGGATNSDVFDVDLFDTLDLGLVYEGNPTVTGAGNTIGAPDIVGDGITTPQQLYWGLNSNVPADIDIPAGTAVTISYDVRVLDSVLALTALNNSVYATWTGIDGVVANERDGSDGAVGPNDYITSPVIETVTTQDVSATISKVRSNDTFNNTGQVRIGDLVEYTLTINASEGTLGNVTLVDSLPQGLDFQGVVSINTHTGPDPFSSVYPVNQFTYADIPLANIVETGNPTTSPTTVTWNLGNITNQPNDGVNDNFVIVYIARVVNDAYIPPPTSVALLNSINLNYDKSTGTVVETDTETVTAMHPVLAVTKTASPANGDILIDANEIITYTVTVTNSGDAPAYDPVVQDIIPAGLRNGAATITMSSITLNGVARPLPLLAPAYNAGTGVATWDFDTGVIDDYTILPGQQLIIVYQVQADAAITGGLTMINAVQVPLYYSFDDDAVPTVAPYSGTRQIYGPTNTATTTLYTAAPPTKALISPVSSEATIGEEILYRMTVPGTLAASTLYDVQVTDALDANLEIVSVSVTGGNGLVNTSTATQMNLSFTDIPANTQAVIDLRVRIRNVMSAQQGTAINNNVSYTYAYAPAGATQPIQTSTDIVTVNIVEPNIAAMTKTGDNLTPTAGDIVRYSVVMTASGGIDASHVYDVTLTDTLGLGLVYEGNPTVTVGAGPPGDNNTINAPVISGDGITVPQTLVWSLANGNADIDINEGTVVTVEYDVRVLNGVLANQVLTNSVVADWTGIDGANAFERDGSDGIGNLNDYITAPVVEVLNTPNINATITKVRSTDTYGAGDDNVRIGDIVEYTVTLNIPEGTLGNAQIIDALPLGLSFEGVVSINSDTTAPYSASGTFAYADIPASSIVATAGSPTTVTWNLGNVTNLPNDGVADNFVVVYRARVMNNVLPTGSLNIPLNNLVDITYDTATVPVTNSDIDTIITALQPSLTASKSALPAGGDNIIVANEVVQYTVSVTNGGTAPAYDLVLQDIIPAGMRNGAATVTMVSTTLGGAGVANVTPSYDPVTGVAIWNFDTGVANAYTIDVGETLTIVYQAQADADLGAGITLTNAATGTNYYSFDDEAVPSLGGINGVRQVYGPTNTATTTLNSQAVTALSKTNPVDTTVSIGETFTYRIRVPAAPLQVALHDVRITDNFVTDSQADLSFVSVTKVFGTQTWTPQNTGTATNIVIEDTTDGIDIPAGEYIEIDVTVLVMDTGANFSGLLFTNTADYTYNQFDDVLSQQPGLPGITGNMQIVGPDTFTMTKTGPVNIQIGTPETYTLTAENTGTAPAYDLTITDILPNPVPGGMCDVAPYNPTAQIYDAGGIAVGGPLVLNTDYTMNFVSGSPTCTLTFTMTSLAAAVPENHRLVITYVVELDTDSLAGVALTNYAGASEWFSGDTAGAGATGQIRTYTETFDGIDPGTVGTMDDEDAHTVTTASPVVQFTKDVYNVTTSQSGATASPGDTLRYTITATNVSPVSAPNFSIVDELDANNATQMFVAGSLGNFVIPGTALNNSDSYGGTNGTGLVNISNLSLDAMGGTNPTVTIQFDVTLVPVIDSGTYVYNQGIFEVIGVPFFITDDPNVNGIDDPFIAGGEDLTQTLINSAPQFQVQKTSADITGSPTQLLPGDTLRYTITVKNIGTENAVNTSLADQIPPLTTYVPGSTTLNGAVVADPAAGVSALEAGMLINAPAPEDTTAGFMRADADPVVTSNIATITFDVVIDANVVNGAIISNQGYVNGEGAGSSGPVPQQPSDDPTTPIAGDPTVNIVGNLPFLDAQKTVAISVDGGTPGQVDGLDELRYTITVTNYGNVPATGVTLTDAVPTNTSFISGSMYLNNEPVPDTGVSPLIAGLPISSSDQTPPLPTVGYLSPGETATITFDVLVLNTVVPGDQIVNQGTVSNNETPDEPTDADGIDSNGDQPTVIVVGNVQLLTVSKQVSVVGGGAALANGYLEYVVRATNVGTVDAYNVEIRDVINTLQMTYMAGTGTMNGLTTGVNYDVGTNTLTADYFNNYGVLASGETVELRFRVQLANLPLGTQVSNTGTVYWDAMLQSASDTVTIDIGGIPGVASLSGQVWHDADFDNSFGATETPLANWEVRVFFRGVVVDSVFTDINGQYQILGLSPNNPPGTDDYQLRFYEPGSSATTAKLGLADSPFTDDLHHIYNILVASATYTQNLNLPIDPNGVVYDSIVRTSVAGATVRLLDANGVLLPASCFDDPAQREQVTLANGFYKFDINFSQPECAPNSEYLVQVTPPATGYIIRDPAPLAFNYSVAIPPQTSVSTTSYDVPACPADAVGATANCEVQSSAAQPGTSIPPRTPGTVYHMRLTLNNGAVPEDSQLFNNHIALDPDLTELVTVTKTTPKVNVVRGDLVPYTIVISNTLPVALDNVSIWDVFPPGFKYVRGSARFDGVKTEPVINGQLMEWNVGTIGVDAQHTIKLLFIVGSGVQEGEYENDALVWSYLTSSNISGTATATVRVVPDPTFDCTDIIGKVFDDKNLNGIQDNNEPGLPGVRLATARGLLVTTDKHGRYHVTCAAVPNEQRGTNFIIKLDDRTLPTGFRVTTENPRVQRVTRGKFSKFNFGATIHRVITLDIAEGVFETDSTDMRGQWVPRLGLLIEELRKGPSVLRITYLADVEDSGLVKDRVNALKQRIMDHWEKLNGYKLTIETEIFWRHGKPVDNGGFD